MNDSKMEVICFGTSHSLSHLGRVNVAIGGSLVNLAPVVKNLGILDSQLTMERHVTSTCKSAYFHLRNIARICKFLPRLSLERLIHAFIFSKLDYCNVLFLGLPLCLLRKLQLVQNSAARLLSGCRKYDHISPVLRSLHWLPIECRIEFKVLLLVFKALHGLAPMYIVDLLTPRNTTRRLRSSDSGLLEVPFTRSSFVYKRAFSHVAPRLWNDLPTGIRMCNTVDCFKKSLKTHLFRKAFN